jgi:hypothetical protein
MKKTDPALIQELREHAKKRPEDSYDILAATFGISAITVKRICADLGRGKDWRRGRKSPLPDENNFWKRVDKSLDGCWMWTGSRTDDGYGIVWHNGKCQCAHRVAYEITCGPIPEGHELDHTCQVRACCNPDHLKPMTHAENMELVRSLQAKQSRSTAGDSIGSTDTGSSIDTGEKAKSKALFDVAHPIINEDKINPAPPSERPVSVSIEPVSSSVALGVIAEREDLDLDRVTVATDKVGNPGPLQASEPKLAELYFYEVSSSRNDIRVKVLAHSELDAGRWFESEWGAEFDVSVMKLESSVDEKVAAVWLSRQERELASEFYRWQRSEEGHRYYARVAREAERKLEAHQAVDARRSEEEVEKETDRCLAEQDYLLARSQRRLAAGFPRKRPPQLPRRDPEPTYRSRYDDKGYYCEDEHGL